MLLSGVLVCGGALVASAKLYQENKKKKEMPWTFYAEKLARKQKKKKTIGSLVASGNAAFQQFSTESISPLFEGTHQAVKGFSEAFGVSNSSKQKKLALLIKDESNEQLGSQAREGYNLDSEQKINRMLTAASVSLGLSTAGLGYAPLGLLSVPGILYIVKDIFISAYQEISRKNVSVDALLLLLVFLCLAKGYFFLCSLNAFMAIYNRKLLAKIKDDSESSVIDVFKQHPELVWVLSEGVEIETSFEALQVGDIVVIAAGGIIPVDGYIQEGVASIDQHVLTGESQPAEKTVGDQVFALTMVLAGKIYIKVEKTGKETTAAKIGEILNQTVNFKMGMQLQVEEVGDKAVLPTMLLGCASLPFLGVNGATAILCSHPKYKTTIASYLGILSYFELASEHGLLIKDGRVLELLNQVDTVVFDKTGTLTKERPHVGSIHATERAKSTLLFDEDDILTYAAAAEQKQTHPIALAILQEAQARQLLVPEIDHAAYKIGYGLTVKVDNQLIRVGSTRFIEMEGIPIPPQISEIQNSCHRQGYSLILVALDDYVIGAIELHPTVRPEAKAVISGLRQRGMTSIYIISGDHEAPTRKLAQALGVDHYFAEVLPENKAELIEQLQTEGRSVCFVGDGINDAIALKKAQVSVSLQGASTVATDTAQVILMDQSLNQLCYLFDTAYELNTNMKRTFVAVLIPHLIGFGGALFLHFGLLHSMILNQIGLTIGAGNALWPRLQQRQKLADNHSEELSRDDEVSGLLS